LVSLVSQQEHRRARRRETGCLLHPILSTSNSKKNHKNVRPSWCVILCDPVVREKFKLGIGQLFLKNIHEMFYGFMSTGLGFDQRACMVYRNKAIPSTCVCPRTGINTMCAVLPSRPRKTCFSFFWVPKQVLLWSKYRGGKLGRVEGNSCTMI
jgi:hypothetical protein